MADVQREKHWKSPMFRHQIVTRIDEAMRSCGGSFPIRGNATQIESYIFERSRTFEEYMHDVGRLMLMSNPQARQQNQQSSLYNAAAMHNRAAIMNHYASMVDRQTPFLGQTAPVGTSQRVLQQQALPVQGGTRDLSRQAISSGDGVTNLAAATSSAATMGPSSVSIKAEECSVCLESYTTARPKEALILCGHCYCNACVLEITRRDPVFPKCPICKAIFFGSMRIFDN